MDDTPRAPRSTLILLGIGLAVEVTGFRIDDPRIAMGLFLVGGAMIGASVGSWLAGRRRYTQPPLPLAETTAPPDAPTVVEKTVEKTVRVESPREWLSEPLLDLLKRLSAPDVTQFRRDALMEAAIGKWLHVEAHVRDVGKYMETAGIVFVSFQVSTSESFMLDLHFDSNTDAIVALNKDDRLVAVGRIGGWQMGNLVLNNCELVRSYQPLMVRGTRS